ncbi:FAD-dependent oxidoreductase [Chitinophagaceae bacterium LB-8]|uniref:FAD-dependent oxidoreductase n=1 Tax=Paraflavisolibacter caeni TaxID=2982496 RepID=A0A9X2XU92_9BACT|nr:FAD-dependent oxidoreductase [Paraflavisolibacter caeni]MCU7549334.1 FAD-dependent oxidoreductase [Paraflavisolibacter caeni]
MQVDILIIGQGICGTMLSWNLFKEGKSFLIVDNNLPAAPSKVAAGVINPVTGRRYSYSWMIDTLMPFAHESYAEIGNFLDQKISFEKSIIDFFPSAQMRDAFVTRMTENDTYLHTYPDQNQFNQYFNYEFGCGKIQPAYTTDLQTLLSSWRSYLTNRNLLLEEDFKAENLSFQTDSVSYNHITAEKIIFCDGIHSMNYSWFKGLPFAPSKGEAILIESKELTNQHIFKKSMAIVPLFSEDLFWVGSSYEWDYSHPNPTNEFLEKTKFHLDTWLKVPYKIVDHKAALRPSTLERRPFVGFHPQNPMIGILNGMGTKGASLTPYFAQQLAQHIVNGVPITPEADINRFQRILSK